MKTNLSMQSNRVFAKEVTKFNAGIKIKLADRDYLAQKARKKSVIKTEFIKIDGIEIF